MTRLSIELLGPFQVRLDEQNLMSAFRTDKERALLAYLSYESHRAHRREVLAELFWPERPEGNARTNLRQALYGLRLTLGDRGNEIPFLLVSEETVQLNPASDFWLDAREFDLLLRRTQNHQHQSLDTCLICTQHLKAAAELYRGEFLSDLVSSDSQGFMEWTLFQREQYFRRLLVAIQNLTDYFRRVGDSEQVFSYAWRQVELAPLEEQAHRQLMVYLATSGRRNAALEQYLTLRRLLADELGVEPAAETTALYEKIRAGLKLEGDQPGSEKPASNLPAPATQFVGREKELKWFGQCLNSRVDRLVSIIGMAGAGKTRLAVQMAGRHLRQFPDGVWFIPVDELSSADQLIPSIIQAMGVPVLASGDIRLQLFQFLRPLHALLIFDGFERMAAHTDLLLAILQNAPGIRLLVTSRVRLGFQTSCVLEVNGLPYPSGSRYGDPISYPAVQLFLAGMKRNLGSTVASSQNLQDIIQICQQVDGLPLALELAAANLKKYPLAKLAEELSTNSEMLKAPLVDLPERQRSLFAAFDDTWNALADREKRAFLKVAALPDGFSAEDELTEAGISPQLLTGLVNHSLVIAEDSERYAIHPLLRHYAALKLQEDPSRIEEVPEEQITTTALLDPITRLPNRLLFRDRLKHILARSRRNTQLISVMMLQMDCLISGESVPKKSTQDLISQIMARRLISCLRQSDTVSRFVGGEYGIILEDIASQQDCLKVARKILDAIGDDILVDNQTICIRSTLGVTLFPGGSEDVETVIAMARAALERAKREGMELSCYGMETPPAG